MATASDHLTDEVLAASVEGNLRPAEQHRVDRHLATCPACLERPAALHALLAEAGLLPPALSHHPLERALARLQRIAPWPVWAWHALLFGVTPLLWLVAVDLTAIPWRRSVVGALAAWPAALLMTTHFLWLQPRLRTLLHNLWEAGTPEAEVTAFAHRTLAPLQGWGWGGGWLFVLLTVGGSAFNQLSMHAVPWEWLKEALLGFYAGLATAAMYWGWLWGGRLWWALARLEGATPALLNRARRLALGWVVVAGGSMGWHLLLAVHILGRSPGLRVWSVLIGLILLSLWSGYAALELRLVRRRGGSFRAWPVAVRLGGTLLLVVVSVVAV